MSCNNTEGCEVNGYCMGAAESGACGTCYWFEHTVRGKVYKTYRFFSYAAQGKCDKCRVGKPAGPGELPPQIIEPFDTPCKTCTDGVLLPPANPRVSAVPRWSKKKIEDKEGDTPCHKCKVLKNGDEEWESCADQNQGKKGCECDTSGYRPKCVCCSEVCGVCDMCVKKGYKTVCEPICANLTNHICVGGSIVNGTKGDCECKFVAYDSAGLSLQQRDEGRQMCTEADPTPKADCSGCECTKTCLPTEGVLDPMTCSCVPACPGCGDTTETQGFRALNDASSCEECRETAPGVYRCVNICIDPFVCDGSGGCYDPNTGSGLSTDLMP